MTVPLGAQNNYQITSLVTCTLHIGAKLAMDSDSDDSDVILPLRSKKKTQETVINLASSDSDSDSSEDLIATAHSKAAAPDSAHGGASFKTTGAGPTQPLNISASSLSQSSSSSSELVWMPPSLPRSSSAGAVPSAPAAASGSRANPLQRASSIGASSRLSSLGSFIARAASSSAAPAAQPAAAKPIPGPAARPPRSTQRAAQKRARSNSPSPLAETADCRPWSEQHAPLRTADVAWHKPKLDLLLQTLQGGHEQQPCVMFLVGPPGVGKSAAVRAFAAEHGATVRTWVDRGGSGSTRPPPAQWGATDTDSTTAHNWLHRARGEADVRYVSSASDLESFLLGSSRFSPLDMQQGNSGRGAGPPASQPAQPSQLSGTSILLMEDIPVEGAALQGVQTALHRHLQAAPWNTEHNAVRGVPAYTVVVVIVSSGPSPGSSASLPAVAQWFGAEVTSHPRTLMVTLPPVPVTRMTKAATRVLQLEGWTVSKASQRSGTNKKRVFQKERLEHLCSSCGGDLRFALNMLQMEAVGDNTAQACGTPPRGAPRAPQRDAFLDPLHALGKLLYAKRGEDGCRESDPDAVAASTAYDGATVTAFLHHNMPEFFTDVSHLASSCADMVAADVLISTLSLASAGISDPGAGRFGPNHSNGGLSEDILGGSTSSEHASRGVTAAVAISAEAYALTISARSVGTRNMSPAPRRFRPLCKPPCLRLHQVKSRNAALLVALGGACENLMGGLSVALWDLPYVMAASPGARGRQVGRAMSCFGACLQRAYFEGGAGGLKLCSPITRGPAAGMLGGEWAALLAMWGWTALQPVQRGDTPAADAALEDETDLVESD